MAALPIDPRALGSHMLVTGCRPAKEYKDGVPTGKVIVTALCWWITVTWS